MHAPILVVDDFSETCQRLMPLFSRYGLAVDCVRSGQEALVYVTKHTPSAVIVDNPGPGMNGLEVIRKLRALDNDVASVPVVLYTAVRDTRLRDQAIALGAWDVWTKSDMTVDEMHGRLIQWLDDSDGGRAE